MSELHVMSRIDAAAAVGFMESSARHLRGVICGDTLVDPESLALALTLAECAVDHITGLIDREKSVVEREMLAASEEARRDKEAIRDFNRKHGLTP